MTQENNIKIKEIIKEQLGQSDDYIKDEHSLIHDLGADSLDILELSLTLEDEFGFELEDDFMFQDTLTVGALINYISTKS